MRNGKIILEGMRFFAFHGCYPGEREQGNWFEADITVQLPILKPAIHDDLTLACDYSDIYRIVREEMSIQKFLLESLAFQIARRILEEHSILEDIEITLKKMNPPVAGEIKSSAVSISLNREELNSIALENPNN
jgi:7,8-dihydroneopterin aldolase/epimerase/oxygenase